MRERDRERERKREGEGIVKAVTAESFNFGGAAATFSVQRISSSFQFSVEAPSNKTRDPLFPFLTGPGFEPEVLLS